VQEVHDVHELLNLSLTRLKPLVPLLQLYLQVLDVVLGGSQLVFGMLQLGVGVVKRVRLLLKAAVHLQWVIAELLVAPFKGVRLLK
jgi:hypothetical protein